MQQFSVKIRPTLDSLEKGDKALFELERMRSVRVIASELNVLTQKRFSVHADRAARTIEVTRIL